MCRDIENRILAFTRSGPSQVHERKALTSKLNPRVSMPTRLEATTEIEPGELRVCFPNHAVLFEETDDSMAVDNQLKEFESDTFSRALGPDEHDKVSQRDDYLVEMSELRDDEIQCPLGTRAPLRAAFGPRLRRTALASDNCLALLL